MMQFLYSQTPLAYFISSFWRDEAFSYLMARLPIVQLLWSTAQDANPPLYYLLLKVWIMLFGTSEIALRSMSLLFFWTTLAIVYRILHETYKMDKVLSLLSLLLFLLNPLLNYYAFEARMYSMVACIATLLFYALLQKKYKLYSITALIALYTHYFLIVVLLFQSIYILLFLDKKEKNIVLHSLKSTLPLYIPWVIMLLFAHPPLGNSFWIATTSWKDFVLIPAVILTGYESGSWIVVSFLSTISLVVSTLICYGIVRLSPQHKKFHLILLVGWALLIPLGVFLLSFIKPVFLPRYLIFSTVGISLLLILSIHTIRSVPLRILAVTVLFGLLNSYSSAQIQMRKKAPLREVFSKIKSEMKRGDVLYVTHDYDFHPAKYYLPTTPIYLYGKTYEELPWFIGKVLIDKKDLRDTLPLYPERAFILNNDGSYSIMAR